jgi:acyl carrier protein
MIPGWIVEMERLPLTANGKVDRESLPAPEGYQPEMEATYISPRNEVERKIAHIWQETLHLEKVGIHDNFFSLGGHSVLMAQVHTRLREVFDKDITLLKLFEHPTINALAKYFSADSVEPTSLDESQHRASSRLEMLKHRTRIRQEQEGVARYEGASDD